MVSFCWLNVMVHLQAHRHKAEPSCSHSQGLWHSLNNIAPGILSVSLLNPFFPFMAMLEVSQRQNSSASGACTMEDRHLRLQLGEGGGRRCAPGGPRVSWRKPFCRSACERVPFRNDCPTQRTASLQSCKSNAFGFLPSKAFSNGLLPFQD